MPCHANKQLLAPAHECENTHLLLKQQPLLTELLESSFSPAEHAARTCELGKKNQKHGTKKRDIRAVLTSKTN
jgi:hypothetical protein